MVFTKDNERQTKDDYEGRPLEHAKNFSVVSRLKIADPCGMGFVVQSITRVWSGPTPLLMSPLRL